ncbi:hypothetical protein QBC32DRAFT_224922, partial [Pseudoneurospora amorphoporcata]
HTVGAANPHFLEFVEAFAEVSFSLIFNPESLDREDSSCSAQVCRVRTKQSAVFPNSVKLGPQDLGVLPSMSHVNPCDVMRLPVERDGVQEDRLGNVPAPGVCHERLPTDGHCSSSHLAGTGPSPFASLEVNSALLKANQSYGRMCRVGGTLQKRRISTGGFYMAMRLSNQYSSCTDRGE